MKGSVFSSNPGNGCRQLEEPEPVNNGSLACEAKHPFKAVFHPKKDHQTDENAQNNDHGKPT
eukprot:8040657-Ditylum_brightwellii.AAC.1